MKLENVAVEVSSGGIMSEDTFGISDMGMILMLLREKIYTNPVAAVCREISCNARDAHREVGKPSAPIRITLPTYLDPNYRVRDFGPGISEDRMKNVFIKYAASTKRGDNFQTGGFGLGAKTPFGYADSFIINTYIGGMFRSYSAVIDDSRCGKLMLMSEQPMVDEPDGTEIVVPVRKQDFGKFLYETHHCTRHWDVKPIIEGQNINYDDFTADKVVLEGQTWFITRESGGDRRLRLVVDGIEYPFQFDWLDTNILPKLAYGTTLFLKFGVGVIPLSANREQVELNDETKRVVSDMLNVVRAELRAKFEQAVASATTYAQANLELHKICNALGMDRPDDITWNGFKLYGKFVRLSGAEANIYTLEMKNGKEFAKKADKNSAVSMEITDQTIYCLNDVENCTESAVRAVFKAFEGNMNGRKTVTVLKVYDPKSTYLQDSDLALLGFVKISDYHTPRKARTQSALKRLTFYKYETRQNKFARTSVESFEADPNKKIWVTLDRNDYTKSISVKTAVNEIDQSRFRKFVDSDIAKGYSVYGFMSDIGKDRIAEATEDMESIETVINRFIQQNNINLENLLFTSSHTSSYSGSSSISFAFSNHARQEFVDHFPEIHNQNSSYAQYLNTFNSLNTMAKQLEQYVFIFEYIKATGVKPADLGKNLQSLQEKMFKDYPMLTFVERSWGSDFSIDKVVGYVNMVDKLASMEAKNNTVTFADGMSDE